MSERRRPPRRPADDRGRPAPANETRVLPCGVRFRSAQIAALIAVAAHSAASRADPAADPRDAFGLRKRPQPTALASCEDGLAFACATATDPMAEATPYGLTTWLTGDYLRRLPVGDATHEAVASYALGAGTSSAGPTFGGASGLENRWTIDGAPADNLRTGGSDTRIPLSFLDGILVSAGGFSARDRASTGGTIDARLRRGTPQHEVAVDVSTTLTRAPTQRPLADGDYFVRRLATDAGPRTTASIVATGPLGRGAWYAAGLAPQLAASNATWRAAQLVDADDDGIPDGFPDALVLEPISTTRARTYDGFVPAMARLGLDRGAHHLELTAIGEVQDDVRWLSNATQQAAGVDRRTWTGDAIATWRGTWADTHARVQLAWHRSVRRESAHDPAANIPQVLSSYVPAELPDDPALAAACEEGVDGANSANCPVLIGFFASGGAGPLSDVVGDRPSATADLAHRVGSHVLRAGGTYEDSQLVTTTRFTGGEQNLTLFPGENARRRFYEGPCSTDIALPCTDAARSRLEYRTRYAAAYVEDTFSPSPGLSIDAGLRWELMWVGDALQFSRQVSPRVGVVWDVLGGGRSRLWANLGTTFALLPAGLGATVIRRDATADDYTFEGGGGRTFDPGTAFAVADGVAPIQQDEITAGAQVALAGALRATLWGQGRFVRRGLETVHGTFDNPGRNAEDAPATRLSELVAFQLEMAHPRTSLRTGVMWGRVEGTWTGLYDPRQGVTQLRGSDWDGATTNLYGRLPTAPGGRMFFEAERRGALGGIPVSAATRFTAASGAPRSALGIGPDGLVQLIPRGSAGRNPVIAQANLRLAARWQGFTATLDVVNLFDRRVATSVDELYSEDGVRAVSGRRYEDLVFVTSDDGHVARRLPSFQLPTEFQAPLSISLGIHRAF